MLGGSGTIRYVSAGDSMFFCDGVSEGIPLCVLMCILTKWLLCPQLSRLKQELAQMRQELQYKEMGVETLQE